MGKMVVQDQTTSKIIFKKDSSTSSNNPIPKIALLTQDKPNYKKYDSDG